MQSLSEIRREGSIIEGERLYLRPLQESNAKDFCAWFGDKEVTKFLGMEPLSKSKARTLFNRLFNDPKGVYFAIIRKGEERAIGYVWEDPDPEKP